MMRKVFNNTDTRSSFGIGTVGSAIGICGVDNVGDVNGVEVEDADVTVDDVLESDDVDDKKGDVILIVLPLENLLILCFEELWKMVQSEFDHTVISASFAVILSAKHFAHQSFC